MCFFKGGGETTYNVQPASAVEPAPIVSEAPATTTSPAPSPSTSSPQVTADARRKKLDMLKQGRLSTIKTSAQGITPPLAAATAGSDKDKLGS